MKLTVLVDNNTLIDRYFTGEPGVSYYIESDEFRILFDTGYSDCYLRNATKLAIDLRKTTHIILSHGHLDHTFGIPEFIKFMTETAIEGKPMKAPTFIAHPNALDRKVFMNQSIGTSVSQDVLSNFFHLKLSIKPVWLSEKLLFLGEIPRHNDFESKEPIGKTFQNDHWQDDYVLDDTALVYHSKEGLVIITGCSHAGICNIIEHAKAITGENRILDVIGGFHLLNAPVDTLNRTADYFEKNSVVDLHACHCTDLNAKIALSKVATLHEVGVGLTLSYE